MLNGPTCAPHLPAPEAPGRPRLHPLREILAAIFYIARSGCACSLVLIAQSIPSPPKGYGTLDEAGDPRLWFRVTGRPSTGPPHREKETITASEIYFLTATELVRLVRAYAFEEATRHGERRPPPAG
jgi:hypothetical protein